MKIITLLTDFGLNDVYVGVMKGVIATINPEIKVIDITHNIPPQNIAAARFCLINLYSYFPPDTIHIAVVDPGVGSSRRGIAIKSDQGYFIGPDNGIFSGILSLTNPTIVVELNNKKYWRTPNPSNTFHGRDIFAPVGAYLSNGVQIENLGSKIDLNSLVKFTFPEYQKIDHKITGCVQYIDYFGNIITNIPANIIEPKNWSVKINNFVIPKGSTYNDVKMGEFVSIIGSHGWLEIALNCGNAAAQLQLKLGTIIEVELL
jgi:hypothetical protein